MFGFYEQQMPATLFFGPDGQERAGFRVVGFMNAEGFFAHLGRLFTPVG